MEHENITYPEALKMVAKRYGIEVKEKEMTEEEVRRNDDRESMFALNGWAAEYFADYLHHETEGHERGPGLFPPEARHDRRHDQEIRTGILSGEGRPDVEGRPGGGIIKRSFWSRPDFRWSATGTDRSTTVSATA